MKRGAVFLEVEEDADDDFRGERLFLDILTSVRIWMGGREGVRAPLHCKETHVMYIMCCCNKSMV